MKQKLITRNTGFALLLTAVAAATMVACGGEASDDVKMTADADSAEPGRVVKLGATDTRFAGTARAAAAASIATLTQVSATRIDRTLYEYVYKVSFANGATPQTSVTATLVSAGAGTTIRDAAVFAGNLAANQSVTPESDTITIRHDRSVAFSPSRLTWRVMSNETDPDRPDAAKMQWFGYTNYHVQMGRVGVIMDGAWAFGKRANDTTLVPRILDAMRAGGASFDYMVLEHNHGDHSANMPELQRRTGAKYYSMAAGCTTAAGQNIPCETVKGGEVLPMGQYVTAYPIRAIHGIECGSTLAANGGTETINWLFVVETKTGRVAFVLTGSGVGGPDAQKEVIINGVNLGSADGNFRKAMQAAGVGQLDLLTMGPEQRYSTQALLYAPQYRPKVMYLTHNGGTAGEVEGVRRVYDLLEGLHYKSADTDSPQLMKVLRKYPESKFAVASNYWDAWNISTAGFQTADNTVVKSAMGLPAVGPGPLPQLPYSVRSRPPGDFEGIDCPLDDYLFSGLQ